MSIIDDIEATWARWLSERSPAEREALRLLGISDAGLAASLIGARTEGRTYGVRAGAAAERARVVAALRARGSAEDYNAAASGRDIRRRADETIADDIEAGRL